MSSGPARYTQQDVMNHIQKNHVMDSSVRMQLLSLEESLVDVKEILVPGNVKVESYPALGQTECSLQGPGYSKQVSRGFAWFYFCDKFLLCSPGWLQTSCPRFLRIIGL